jgi:hypothetical protein
MANPQSSISDELKALGKRCSRPPILTHFRFHSCSRTPTFTRSPSGVIAALQAYL